MIVNPDSNMAETRLSTTDAYRSSFRPKNKIRKLITANETEYSRRIIMFLKFRRMGLSCISQTAYK
ncbi:MAG: hypothetical protein EDM72_07320 [Chlorobiota bacterium]|nr:MAG: hypothetical protein EDM72_07320 [Chlorobiota bacterium]